MVKVTQDSNTHEMFSNYFCITIFLYPFKSGDRELVELWSKLQLVVSRLFKEVDVYPSLLHGDLWGGNAAEVDDGPGEKLK